MTQASTRWSTEQVSALAPARLGAARPLAVPALWDSTGCDDRSVWGRFRGGRGEPYQTMVDHDDRHRDVGARCSCPSRVTPCKHAIALLLLWSADRVPHAPRPAAVQAWVAHRDAGGTPERTVAGRAGSSAGREPDVGAPATPGQRPERRDGPSDDRSARMRAGLRELERWVEDRVRTGLGDPSIARYSTWDDVATRLVDAQASGLANRVRRLAGHVGARPGWHEHVLAELGVLHLLARAGQHLGDLDDPWHDGVSAALGVTVKQADVRAGVPDTGRWRVMGRSDIVEDRIVVRRLWLRDTSSPPSLGRHPVTAGWAVLLSFAAYGQSLDDTLVVGSVHDGDLHRYPGTVPLRALRGDVRASGDAVATDVGWPSAPSIAAAREEIGHMLGVEPWLERVPTTLTAAPTQSSGSWVLTDHTGTLPLAEGADIAVVLAASGGDPVTLTGEWTASGLVPLTLHLADRALDIGPRGGFR